MIIMQLLADTRESHVLVHKEEFKTINLEVKQFDKKGDYILCKDGKIITIFERKTLPDFAASFKDGRSENKAHLLEIRRQTGCNIVYIIEGPAYPEPNKMFGNIAYKNIESSIFHLMYRDNITIIWSKDTLHTAKLLVRYYQSIANLLHREPTPALPPVIDRRPVDPQLADPGITVGAGDDGANQSPVASDPIPSVTDILAVKFVKPDVDIVRQMWSCIPGIAMPTADCFMMYTLADLIGKKIDFVGHKVNNRKISIKVYKSVTNVGPSVIINMIACIPGISKKTAEKIYIACPDFTMIEVTALSEIMIDGAKGAKKLGVIKAKAINHYFNYSDGSLAKVNKNEVIL